MKKSLAWALCVAAAAASAQERPSDYAYAAPLLLDSGASHYRFALPAAAYHMSTRRDLADLRVFNAAGEPVPYAFAARETTPPAPELRSTNLFPLYGDQAKGVASNVTVKRSTQGTVISVSVTDPGPAAKRTLLGYLLDASELKAAQEAMLLTWQSRHGFSGQARVESSDDLKNWASVTSNAPILHLEHAGARLERNRVDLNGTRGKYLRISFEDVPADFELKAVAVELRPERPEPPREWLSLLAMPTKVPGELVVDTAGHYPVDRLRVVLPQLNTVARVRLQSRDRADDPWRTAASGTVYRLAQGGKELTNPELRLPVTADRYWRIVVDQKGGGFGAGEVRLEFGWVPHEVLFAARGAAPFVLSYGNKIAKSGALPLTAVLPREEEVAAARAARVGEPAGAPASTPSVFNDPARFFRAVTEHREFKKWILWSALVGGLLFLAWMSMRLLQDLGRNSETRREP